MSYHGTFPDKVFERFHPRLPFSGTVPDVAHSADFIGIRIMYLGIDKEVVATEWKSNVQWQCDVITGTVVTVDKSYEDVSMKADGLEVVIIVICDKFIEHGVEIDTQLSAIRSVVNKFR